MISDRVRSFDVLMKYLRIPKFGSVVVPLTEMSNQESRSFGTNVLHEQLINMFSSMCGLIPCVSMPHRRRSSIRDLTLTVHDWYLTDFLMNEQQRAVVETESKQEGKYRLHVSKTTARKSRKKVFSFSL